MYSYLIWLNYFIKDNVFFYHTNILTELKNIFIDRLKHKEEIQIGELTEQIKISKTELKPIIKFFNKINVPYYELKSEIKILLKKHQLLLNELRDFKSDDKTIMKYKYKTKSAIERFNFQKAAYFIDRTIQSIPIRCQEPAKLLSESFAIKALFLEMQYQHKDAADYYLQASDFLPDNEELVEQKALYLNESGVNYHCAGCYDCVEKPLLRAKEIYENMYGKYHPTVKNVLLNIAEIYWKQDKIAESEFMYKQVLENTTKVFGQEHIKLATILNNLAILCHIQKKYDEAESYYLKCISIREHNLGIFHNDVAITYNNAGAMYQEQEKYLSAEKCYVKSLDIREKLYGKEHPNVATAINNLATLYKDSGKYLNSELLYKRCLEIREKSRGTNHPTLITTLNNLAELYKLQRKYTEAEHYYIRMVNILDNSKIEVNPKIPFMYENYSLFLKELGRGSESLEYELKAKMSQTNLRNL